MFNIGNKSVAEHCAEQIEQGNIKSWKNLSQFAGAIESICASVNALRCRAPDPYLARCEEEARCLSLGARIMAKFNPRDNVSFNHSPSGDAITSRALDEGVGLDFQTAMTQAMVDYVTEPTEEKMMECLYLFKMQQKSFPKEADGYWWKVDEVMEIVHQKVPHIPAAVDRVIMQIVFKPHAKTTTQFKTSLKRAASVAKVTLYQGPNSNFSPRLRWLERALIKKLVRGHQP